MIYEVTGTFRNEAAAEFHRLLNDGTIAEQKPDGAEIVAAMARAVLRDDGRVQWSEQCFCNPPLAHERATVLDRFFDSIETRPIPAYRTYSGRSFADYLDALAVS